MGYFTGTPGSDTLTGDDGVDFFQLTPGGADEVHARGGDDSIEISAFGGATGSAVLYGEGGDDTFYLRDTTGAYGFSVFGGEGRDFVQLVSGAGAAVDAGGGGDIILLQAGSTSATLGGGHDLVVMDRNAAGATLVIQDYQVSGDSSDRLDFSGLLKSEHPGLRESENPFAKGYLRLVESGGDTSVQLLRSGAFVSIITFGRWRGQHPDRRPGIRHSARRPRRRHA